MSTKSPWEKVLPSTIDAFLPYMAMGWGPAFTRPDGLLCALYSFQGSFNALQNLNGGQHVTLDELKTEINSPGEKKNGEGASEYRKEAYRLIEDRIPLMASDPNKAYTDEEYAAVTEKWRQDLRGNLRTTNHLNAEQIFMLLKVINKRKGTNYNLGLMRLQKGNVPLQIDHPAGHGHHATMWIHSIPDIPGYSYGHYEMTVRNAKAWGSETEQENIKNLRDVLGPALALALDAGIYRVRNTTMVTLRGSSTQADVGQFYYATHWPTDIPEKRGFIFVRSTNRAISGMIGKADVEQVKGNGPQVKASKLLTDLKQSGYLNMQKFIVHVALEDPSEDEKANWKKSGSKRSLAYKKDQPFIRLDNQARRSEDDAYLYADVEGRVGYIAESVKFKTVESPWGVDSVSYDLWDIIHRQGYINKPQKQLKALAGGIVFKAQNHHTYQSQLAYTEFCQFSTEDDRPVPLVMYQGRPENRNYADPTGSAADLKDESLLQVQRGGTEEGLHILSRDISLNEYGPFRDRDDPATFVLRPIHYPFNVLVPKYYQKHLMFTTTIVPKDGVPSKSSPPSQTECVDEGEDDPFKQSTTKDPDDPSASFFDNSKLPPRQGDTPPSFFPPSANMPPGPSGTKHGLTYEEDTADQPPKKKPIFGKDGPHTKLGRTLLDEEYDYTKFRPSTTPGTPAKPKPKQKLGSQTIHIQGEPLGPPKREPFKKPAYQNFKPFDESHLTSRPSSSGARNPFGQIHNAQQPTGNKKFKFFDESPLTSTPSQNTQGAVLFGYNSRFAPYKPATSSSSGQSPKPAGSEKRVAFDQNKAQEYATYKNQTPGALPRAGKAPPKPVLKQNYTATQEQMNNPVFDYNNNNNAQNASEDGEMDDYGDEVND